MNAMIARSKADATTDATNDAKNKTINRFQNSSLTKTGINSYSSLTELTENQAAKVDPSLVPACFMLLN